MISFTESPHAVNLVFETVKPDGSIRLIVDARPANTFFVPPPRVCLPTPECLSQLLLAPDQDLFVAKTDLDNFYHRIKLPLWLHTYFALPGIRVRELDESVRRDGGLGTHSMDAIVFPCLMSLPMGWSFSVYLAQLAHEYIMYTSGVFSPHRSLTHADKSPWSLDGVRHLVYIDDVVFFGVDRAQVDRQQRAYTAIIKDSGLVVKRTKLVTATADPVKVHETCFKFRCC